MHHEMDAEDTTNAVGHAACTLAKDIKAAALIAITKSGLYGFADEQISPIYTDYRGDPASLKPIIRWRSFGGVAPLMVENLQNVDVLVYRCLEEAKRRKPAARR